MRSRDLKNGHDAVEKLRSEGLINVETIKIDVSDQDSVTDTVHVTLPKNKKSIS